MTIKQLIKRLESAIEPYRLFPNGPLKVTAKHDAAVYLDIRIGERKYIKVELNPISINTLGNDNRIYIPVDIREELKPKSKTLGNNIDTQA